MPFVQEYPKYKFHKDREAVLVKTKEEDEKLGTDWKNSPKDFEPDHPLLEDDNDESIVKKGRSKKEK